MADASPTSMSAAAQAYQESIQKYQPRSELSNHPSAQSSPSQSQAPFHGTSSDTVMRDAGYEQQPQQPLQNQPPPLTIAQPSATAPPPTILTPAPAMAPRANPRVGTPGINGHEPVSRPSSTVPDAHSATPTIAVPHGAPARRYLNEKVTGVLLEGMKNLAREQPKDPLRVLGEYLLQRSRELEGT